MKLRNLDVLRACLALMVLIGHTRAALWMSWHEWKTLPHAAYEWVVAVVFGMFHFGSQAVIVFFTLSGFFIHLRAATEAATSGTRTGFSALPYLKRRARRILPPYYASLLFVLLLDTVGKRFFPEVYFARTGDALTDENFMHSGFSLQSVIPALMAQPSLLGAPFGSNLPLWSIGNEVFYYALYPLFMLAWMRSRWLAYGAGLALSITCWIWPLAGCWSGMLSAYPFWLTGALLAEFFSTSHKASRLWFSGMLVLSAGSLGMSDMSLFKSLPWTSLPIGMVLGASTLALFAALPDGLLLSHAGRLLEWLGLRSYSIYIFHCPVLVFLSSAVFHLFGSRPTHGWFAASGAILAMLTSLLAFHLVERRFLPRRLEAPDAGAASRPA